jgi:hypothetical protein
VDIAASVRELAEREKHRTEVTEATEGGICGRWPKSSRPSSRPGRELGARGKHRTEVT